MNQDCYQLGLETNQDSSTTPATLLDKPEMTINIGCFRLMAGAVQ
jgi:hypothetical protein